MVEKILYIKRLFKLPSSVYSMALHDVLLLTRKLVSSLMKVCLCLTQVLQTKSLFICWSLAASERVKQA